VHLTKELLTSCESIQWQVHGISSAVVLYCYYVNFQEYHSKSFHPRPWS
jgi:hypothetical protein